MADGTTVPAWGRFLLVLGLLLVLALLFAPVIRALRGLGVIL